MPPRKVKKAKPENVVWRSDAAASTSTDALNNFDCGSLFEGDAPEVDTSVGSTHVLRKEDCEFSAKSAAILASLDARARKEEAEKVTKTHNDIILASTNDFAGASVSLKDDISPLVVSLSSSGHSGSGSAQPKSPRNSLDPSEVSGDSGRDTAHANENFSGGINYATSSSSSGNEAADGSDTVFHYKGATFGNRQASIAYSSAVSAPLPCHPLNSWYLTEGIPNFSQKSVRGKRLYEHEVDGEALRSLKRVRTHTVPNAPTGEVAGVGASSFDIDIEWGVDAAQQAGAVAEDELLRRVQLEKELEQSLVKELHNALR